MIPKALDFSSPPMYLGKTSKGVSAHLPAYTDEPFDNLPYREVSDFFNIREANPQVVKGEWEIEASAFWDTKSNGDDDSLALVAPNRLPSDAMCVLYRAVREGNETAEEARRILDGITTMGIRLLGDRVSRATAWRVAEKLGWADTAHAEYVAVAQLQADALVALDPELAAAADGVVPLADFDAISQTAPEPAAP